jgi:hypothetical protein
MKQQQQKLMNSSSCANKHQWLLQEALTQPSPQHSIL